MEFLLDSLFWTLFIFLIFGGDLKGALAQRLRKGVTKSEAQALLENFEERIDALEVERDREKEKVEFLEMLLRDAGSQHPDSELNKYLILRDNANLPR